MYRIMRAVNGRYYVQAYGYNGYKMTGPFFRTRAGARNYARDLKTFYPSHKNCDCNQPGFVEYV